MLLGLTHSSWSARILSLCRWKRDPGTSPWLTREGSGWPLGERNVSRECNRKQPPPQTASWSPGSIPAPGLLPCPGTSSLPPGSGKDLLSLLPPAWLPIPSPLHNLPNSTPAALEGSAEGAEAGSLAGVVEEAPSPPLPFQPLVCLRQTKYRARALYLLLRIRRHVTYNASEPCISPANIYLVPALCQTQFCPSYLYSFHPGNNP